MRADHDVVQWDGLAVAMDGPYVFIACIDSPKRVGEQFRDCIRSRRRLVGMRVIMPTVAVVPVQVSHDQERAAGCDP